MKKLVFILALTISMGTTHAGWLDNGEKDRRIEAEQQLHTERQTNSNLGIVVTILAAGCVSLLTIGAAIGSKVRRNAKNSTL